MHLLCYLFALCCVTCCTSQDTPSFCGKIQIQAPFLSSNSTVSSPLNRMIICKSKKLYFRTSLGLFPVSSIDYTTKTLTISHLSCSSLHNYVSPSLLSSGLPAPPLHNSLLLFNCSNKTHPLSPNIRNCTRLPKCGAFSETQKEATKVHDSCLLVDDLESIGMAFHPKDLSCTHYRRVYRTSSDNNEYAGVELGTRISFDIPDHVPDLCNECRKPNGNCGVGLRCICHRKECKDQLISVGRTLEPFGNILFSFLSSIIVICFFMDSCNFRFTDCKLLHLSTLSF